MSLQPTQSVRPRPLGLSVTGTAVPVAFASRAAICHAAICSIGECEGARNTPNYYTLST